MAKKKVQEEAEIEVKPVDNREAALELLRNQLKKSYGTTALISYSNNVLETGFSGKCVGTGILGLDIALKNPIPRGRIVEIYGPESSGKTTLAIIILAEAQKKYSDSRVGFIDVEHAFDSAYAFKLGIKPESLDISKPTDGEQALDVLEAMVRSGLYSSIVVDSVAALVPKAELEGEMGDQQMGLQARLMSKAMRKLAGAAESTDTNIIFINQIRMKIGVMFGSPETTTGGNALKYFSSQRLDIRRTAFLRTAEDQPPYGITTKIKVVKNKVAEPLREVELDLIFGKGFDKLGDLVNNAAKLGIVERNGAWYSHQEQKIGQGLANTIKFLEENPELAQEIEEAVRKKYL